MDVVSSCFVGVKRMTMNEQRVDFMAKEEVEGKLFAFLSLLLQINYLLLCLISLFYYTYKLCSCYSSMCSN